MKKNDSVLFLFIIAKIILQYLLISPEYELHRDEYLHLDQGNHLAWGYLSVPPVNSWLAWLIKILGGSVFWVKFFPALLGAFTIVVVWKTVEELHGNLYAAILASTGVLLSVLLRINMLFQPTSMEVLLWTVLYYMLIRYFKDGKIKWLYIAAVIFGIGFLNKYSIAFSVLGIIPALLLTKQRTVFLQPHLYGAGLLALAVMSPNLLWQYDNNFPVIHHMKELSETQLVNVSRMEFLKSQLLFFAGSVFVILAGLYALLFYKPFEKFRFFFWTYGCTIGLFLLFKAKDYYAAGLYPVFIAFGAVYLSSLPDNGWKNVLKPVCILIPVILFIPMYQAAFPNKSPEYIIHHPDRYERLGLLRWEDGKNHPLPQDFADMQGWKELAEKTDKEYAVLSKSGNTLVLCDNYGQAGAINYYSKQKIHAVSFNADYVNWLDLSKRYDHLIRVKNAFSDNDELKETGPYFETSKKADSIINPFAREKGTAVFSFKNAKIDIRQKLQQEIDEVKGAWER